MNDPVKNERDIQRIIKVGTAIGFGCMVASLESLRSDSTGFSFQITARTFLAFILGFAVMFPFWKIVFNLVSGNRQRSRHVWGALLLLLIGAAAFLYPSRFVPAEKLHDMYIGLALAVCAISLVAWLIFTTGRFLEHSGEDADKKKK